MRNNVRKKMRLICLLFAMVLLARVPAYCFFNIFLRPFSCFFFSTVWNFLNSFLVRIVFFLIRQESFFHW